MASGRSITGILGLDHTTEAAALATAKSGRSAIFIDSTTKKAKIVGEGGLVGELGGGLATATLDNTDDGTTVARGNHYICDTSTAAFGLTLPAGDEGAVIRFSDAAETFGTNALTLTPAAGEIIDGGAADETFVLDLDGGWVQLMWDGSKWVIDASLLAGVSDGTFPGGLVADTVDELTAGAGVTVDGVLLKDGKIQNVVTATRSSNLTLTTGTAVAFDQVTSGYSLSGGGIVCPRSGNYRVSFNTAHNFGTVTSPAYFYILVAGAGTTPYIAARVLPVNHGASPAEYSYHSSGIVSIGVGQVVTLVPVFGGSLNITTTAALQIEEII